jgi:signal peptide peptidase SppA
MERNAMRSFVSLTQAGISADLTQVRAAAPKESRQKAIGIIPVTGPLEARSTLMGELFGMTSYEKIGAIFDHFVADESVSGIILDIASPGGMVYGAQELANKIYSARGTKPIIAVANPLMASGAYWIGAAADRIVMTPSGDVGSVGVIAEHVDMSKAIDEQGAKVTIFRSSGSPFKGENNDAEPLTDEAKQNIQSRVDSIYSQFVGDLAKFRGVSVEHVNEHFGKGRVVDAKTAMRAGMIDRVATMQDITGKMVSGRVRIASERAQDVWDAPTRREMLRERAEQIRLMADEPKEGDAA